ncbi:MULTISPECIES: hypothetical protein [unclassified Paenibacillus]|uniref:hypothetical protein n=1 Tax=unclassified Paenibacillus TaxID=185978 RepID=UPI001AE11E07|nr:MULTISPECIES: hypothetical protein [unclassified Paenibacillus]MBP1157561.1 hypothetical protein [Paenibacillus sp. PvP091]MBP1171702.1 hypothetical protein [Paenibacillus sp. PvR098]MBP2438083.1 hypothetical protein [Paenibacillus sp. PvP052]
MPYLGLTVFGIAILILAVVWIRNARKPSSRMRVLPPPPNKLGVLPGHPAEKAMLRLESALDSDFEARVKDRVLKQHPTMDDSEWIWTWFHLKRFFLMSAVMKQVPMYSAKVDLAWHEMLMFTREYQTFCERFCGSMIHHAPHAEEGRSPNPGERAWFDWIYGELFLQTPECGRTWGAFYRNPLPQSLLERLEKSSAEELRQELFHMNAASRFPDLHTVFDQLIDKAKSQIAEAKSHLNKGNRPITRDTLSHSAGFGWLGGAMIYLSMSSPDDFEQQMEGLSTEEERKTSGSSSSASSCAGDSNDNDGGGGSDGGGSSCGSGCSS